ncbi:MAG: hypothetical protein LBM93_14580 [Oscillospiraceae bacterium]|jgi:hypothetical protein|nr:hypothetical protein [Oscillospiraceae bacterium]
MKSTGKRFEIENVLCIIDYGNTIIDVIGKSYEEFVNEFMECVAIQSNMADDKAKNTAVSGNTPTNFLASVLLYVVNKPI